MLLFLLKEKVTKKFKKNPNAPLDFSGLHTGNSHYSYSYSLWWLVVVLWVDAGGSIHIEEWIVSA
ncbi:MAG: hypothetical protein ACTHOF_12555 [Flavisolibacter sp.]